MISAVLPLSCIGLNFPRYSRTDVKLVNQRVHGLKHVNLIRAHFTIVVGLCGQPLVHDFDPYH